MIAQTDIRTFYEFLPILPVTLWWQILATMTAVVTLLIFVLWTYLRDSRDLPFGLTVTLITLRLTAFVCILIYVLNPSKRSETRIVKTSRLAVLVDTSLSMGLFDQQSAGTANGRRRIDDVTDWLATTPEFKHLASDHDITFYRFGDQPQPEPVGTLLKSGDASAVQTAPDSRQPLEKLQLTLLGSRRIGWLALGTLAIACGVFVTWFFARVANRSAELRARLVCATVYVLLAGLVGLAASDLQSPQFDLWTSLGWKAPDITLTTATSQQVTAPVEDPDVPIQWADALAPRGTSTQLGSAIQHLVNKERDGPIAGIIVVTDGRSNEGVQPARAIAAAVNAGIPVYPIGIGSTEAPKNVLVADIQAPPKVFPSDKFQVKGILKAFGLPGKTIGVQLLSIDVNDEEAETVEGETTVRLAEDGQATPVEFEVERLEQGKRRYIIRSESVDGDLDLRDNQRTAVVEIIERQTKVLLIAGGPNREFRFLRNQLYRDKDISLHVWLQSAKIGADQESDELLHEFPQTREGVFFYDCIIAFDPDWIDFTPQQTELLERWVAEQAGGLIVVAGPVNTPEWTRRPRGDEAIDKIRRLYPVSFYSQGTAQLKLGRFGGDHSFPLGFSREGRAAEFLWLGDSASDSQTNWDRFTGVFGYYAVNEPKPGADVLANFADPDTAVSDRLPIYLASHFYGAGRVFFQASSEMWRIRRLDVEFFQQYYVKLIRWASQGRLLRDSTRGVLLTDRERCWMGDQVVIQAILRDAQDRPLMTQQIDAVILRPDGTTQDVNLEAVENAVRPGTFHGQFTAGIEGDYRISLPIPASPDLEVLTTTVQANIPDLEKEQPQRNDSLLTELAEKTRGHFFVGVEGFKSDAGNPFSPDQLIQPQDQETFLTGTLDRFFQRKLMMWLLGLISTALGLEWTIRRLHRLA